MVEDTVATESTEEKAKSSKKDDLVAQFLRVSGYKSSDVIGHSDERRTVVTSNGGKYEVNKKGTRVLKLLGPDTPATLEAAAGEEDE